MAHGGRDAVTRLLDRLVGKANHREGVESAREVGLHRDELGDGTYRLRRKCLSVAVLGYSRFCGVSSG